jgi:cation:H+ antiporter
MDATVLWVQLAAAAAVILLAAQFMAQAADTIAIRTGLGHAFVGVVMLATATSLPELGTGISSIVILDEPDLAAGDAFGSNLFNLLIIGLLDFFWRDGPLLNRVSITSVVVAALGILAIGFAAAGIFIHHEADFASDWLLSPVTIVMVAVFAVAMFIVYRIELAGGSGGAKDEREPSQKLRRALGAYALSATTVVIAAIWLANIGDSLADELGIERSFVGTQFLALSTSLPELAASVAAIRLGAPELAISNVLGSNLFNMGFVLFVDDVAYTSGPLWADVSTVHIFTALAAVLMTAVVIVALVTQERGRPGRFFTFEALMLVGLYIVTSVLVFDLA